jgi:hypothetical protein
LSAWYYKVTNNLGLIPDFIDFFETELITARKELSLKGNSIEKHASELPGIVETRFSQLQEIEAVLEYLNLTEKKTRSAYFKKYLESYNRTLSSRDAERYIDGEAEIIDLSLLINEVALLRNKYLGISKGLEAKNFMMSNITKLRIAGFEDATIH